MKWALLLVQEIWGLRALLPVIRILKLILKSLF
jgi:hypothetical protein